MSETTKQTLRFAENLALPAVQVIIMSANMNCNHCRQRVSKVISSMNASLVDYIWDLRRKEVTLRGVVDTKRRKTHQENHPLHIKKKNKTPPYYMGLLSFLCSSV